MNKLFVHAPLFRVLSPVCSGAIIYLLILLLNNNVHVALEQFIGQELYFCIGVAYIIQEFSRISILYFSRWSLLHSNWVRVVLVSVVSLLITIGLVSVSMSLYYHWFIGFSPNTTELITFNSIFIVVTLIYITLYVSNDLLARIHLVRLEFEASYKCQLQMDFQQFRRGLNPELLLESLENLIVLSKVDKGVAEEFLNELAQVYRYILSKRNELIHVHEELKVLGSLINLFNHLPSRALELDVSVDQGFFVIPGVLLKLVESAIREAIAHPDQKIRILVSEEDLDLVLSVSFIKKLSEDRVNPALVEIRKSNAVFSDREIGHHPSLHTHVFKIPKLTMQ